MENYKSLFNTAPINLSEPTKDRISFLCLLNEDIQTALKRDPAARSAFEIATTYSGLHAIWFYRFSNWLWKRSLYWLARVNSQIARFFTGVEIHPAATIGRRLFIDHGMGVVIGETAEIADDVAIYHGVTLGGVSLAKTKRHPTIEEGVVIGAGAKVLGDIRIGSYSRIGANAVVIKPVPPHSVVVGVPGQIIRFQQTTSEKSTNLMHADLPDAIVRNLQDLSKRLDELENRLRIPTNNGNQIVQESDGVWLIEQEHNFII